VELAQCELEVLDPYASLEPTVQAGASPAKKSGKDGRGGGLEGGAANMVSPKGEGRKESRENDSGSCSGVFMNRAIPDAASTPLPETLVVVTLTLLILLS
jgi:hypothetical protein